VYGVNGHLLVVSGALVVTPINESVLEHRRCVDIGLKSSAQPEFGAAGRKKVIGDIGRICTSLGLSARWRTRLV